MEFKCSLFLSHNPMKISTGFNLNFGLCKIDLFNSRHLFSNNLQTLFLDIKNYKFKL